jgi:hypothetical protein
MMHRIEQLEIVGAHRLRLRFVDGGIREMDFTPLIQRGGVWAALKDTPSFVGVTIGEHGRSLEWPVGVDFCADAAWLEGE